MAKWDRRRVFATGCALLVALLCWSCEEDRSSSLPDASSTDAATTPQPDLSKFYFPIDIDYTNPSIYLQSGSQSTLTADNAAMLDGQIQLQTQDLQDVGRIFWWIKNNFATVTDGGAGIGVTDVNDLIADRTLHGCTDWALLLSSMLRHFGFPAIMVDCAGITWAEQFRTGQTTMYVGHVYVEVYVEQRWIVVNSTTGRYASNYDFQIPVLPFTSFGESRGHYVLYKGFDPAGYGVTSNAVLQARMREFAEALPNITLESPSYEIRPLPVP